MSALLEYVSGTTLFHRANPLTKVAFALLICVAVFSADIPFTLIALITFEIALAFYTGIGRQMLKLVAGFSVLALLMFLLQTLIIRDGHILFLFITDRGLTVGLRAALRLLAFALPLIEMLMLTKLSDLANAAVEILHVPYRYAFTITTALRFVPIFSSEMSHIMDTQKARGVAFDTAHIFKKIRLMLPLVIPLLISSVAKADQSALAAEQRGFYLRRQNSSFKTYPFSVSDVFLFLFALILVLLGIFF